MYVFYPGLYYLAELAEEFTVVCGKVMQVAIIAVAALHPFLWLIDSMPFFAVLVGLVAHAAYWVQVCTLLLFALNYCLPSTTVCPQLFALNCLPSTNTGERRRGYINPLTLKTKVPDFAVHRHVHYVQPRLSHPHHLLCRDQTPVSGPCLRRRAHHQVSLFNSLILFF